MNRQLTTTDFADMMYATRHYETLYHTFTQIGGAKEYQEGMRDVWDNVISKMKFETWNNINLHYIKQMWSNTSGGWEGIGGSAITTSYTFIIENRFAGLAYIYYDAKLAYVCKIDEDWNKIKTNPPGMSDCKKKLNIIYKSR